MNCFRFANVMSNTIIINSFNSDDSSNTKIKTHNFQMMTTITETIFKFKPMIEKLITTNHIFFVAITCSNITFFT